MSYRSFFVFVLLTVGFMAEAFADHLVNFTLRSGVAVELDERTFVASQFKVEGCKQHEQKCLINGSTPFGVAWGLPKTYVKSIKVTFQNKTYSLNSADMYNAWGTRPFEIPGVVRYFGGKCFDSQNCQFRGLFSDAGGAFVAGWRIVKRRTSQTIVTYSSDVTNLFIKHIDPPEFE